MIDENAAAGWSYVTLGVDNIPVHCDRQALDLDLGEWECAHCDTVVHVRDIPGWPVRTSQLASADARRLSKAARTETGNRAG